MFRDLALLKLMEKCNCNLTDKLKKKYRQAYYNKHVDILANHENIVSFHEVGEYDTLKILVTTNLKDIEEVKEVLDGYNVPYEGIGYIDRGYDCTGQRFASPMEFKKFSNGNVYGMMTIHVDC